MGDHHHHHHGHDHHHAHHVSGNIKLAFFLNLIFTIIELIGGVFTNSVAILSDAIHDLGDTISLGVAWYLESYSQKKRTEFYSYGYKRFSLLGSLLISFLLFFGSIYVVYEAIKRLQNPESVMAEGMLVIALFGIFVNGIGVFRMKGSDKISERAVYLHLLEDVLGWVAVLIVSIILCFVDLPILDPILSIGISTWVLFNVFKNLKKVFGILLQEVPGGIDANALKGKILEIKGVSDIHDLHLWTLDGENHIITLHVVVGDDTTAEDYSLIKEQTRKVCDSMHIHHSTIELERQSEECTLHDC